MKKRGRPLKNKYTVKLELGDKEYNADGLTLAEAIGNLKVTEFRVGGLLTARNGNRMAQRKFPRVFLLKRLLANKVMRMITAKNIEMMMK